MIAFVAQLVKDGEHCWNVVSLSSYKFYLSWKSILIVPVRERPRHNICISTGRGVSKVSLSTSRVGEMTILLYRAWLFHDGYDRGQVPEGQRDFVESYWSLVNMKFHS
jgi:hypothetical protein